MSKKFSRRDFVKSSSSVAMGATIVPRHVLGGVGYQAPSDRLNIALVGVGGRGTENVQELGTENIVAICDVDFGVVHRRVEERLTTNDGTPREQGHRWKEQFLPAKQYTDFRELLANEPDLDGVMISTPDHTHAPIAKAAMEAGLHVYCEKPLTYTVHEAREMSRLAAETGVVTQMGNQGHSRDDGRRVNEIIQAGVLGDVTEVHIWTNRPIWPQGLLRPAQWDGGLNPGWYQQWHNGAIQSLAAESMDAGYKLPYGMDWDLYLGPTTREVPYHPVYHPFNWRGWVDFGVSALGDMGAHLVDHPYWALGLTYPTSVEATSTPWGGPSEDPVSYPQSMRVHYRFPSRGDMPEVDMHWYDGGLMPPRPPGLPDEVVLNRTGGVLYVGSKGILIHETYGANPRVFPEALAAEAEAVPVTIERIADTHHMNWVNACKAGSEASCPFDYAARLTEVMLLGIVALRTGQGTTIRYDGEHMRVTNSEIANQYLTRAYRDGWSV